MNTFYLFQSGRLSRKDNSLCFENEASGKRYIPIEQTETIFVFGELDFNSKLIDFLSKNNITVHFFNYYGFYSGSFYPREHLLSGQLLVKQVEHYIDNKKKMLLSQRILEGATDNILRNLKYYNNRDKDVSKHIQSLESFQTCIYETESINELRGLEGNIRQVYYDAWKYLIHESFEFEKRVKHPPDNPINSLISFSNALVYSTVLGEIYNTQLNPTIGYLHDPGERRFTLSLDIAEIFKPILADRLIFKLINKQQIQLNDFLEELNFCYIKDKARKLILQNYDERLKTTIHHRKLDRQVSYKRLIRLECYKLIKHFIGEEVYEPFKIWW